MAFIDETLRKIIENERDNRLLDKENNEVGEIIDNSSEFYRRIKIAKLTRPH